MAAAARRLRLLLRSTAVLYLLAAAFLLGSAGVLYSRFTFAAFSDSYTPQSPGCRPDGEGSWSIGLFYGESLLKLQPLELREMWRNESAAWPVANPVFTCASVLDARSPSNFVADPFLHILAIEKRIAVFSQVPAENGELIQVLRYEANQFYKPHHDYFSDPYNLKREGQRVATMLIYLSDDVEGGETYFPLENSWLKIERVEDEEDTQNFLLCVIKPKNIL